MGIPAPGSVAPHWRKPYVAGIIIVALASISYLVHKVHRLYVQGVEATVAKGAHFGHLPDVIFTTETKGNLTFPAWHLSLANGMEAGGANAVDIGIDVLPDHIVFKTSAIKVPDFSAIEDQNIGHRVQPYVRFAVAYKKAPPPRNSSHERGLYLFARYKETEHSKEATFVQMGSRFGEALRSRTMDEYVLSVSAFTDVWSMTSDVLNWEYFSRGFEKRKRRLHFDSLYRNQVVDMPLCDDSNPSSLFDISQFVWQKEGNGVVQVGVDNDICDPEIKRFMVVLYVFDETTTILTRRGFFILLPRMLSSMGGLLSIVSIICAVIFVKKNAHSDVVKTYDEVTLVMDRNFCDASAADIANEEDGLSSSSTEFRQLEDVDGKA